MNLQHLNSIEKVMDNAINLSMDKKEMPIDKWSIILKPWCDTLDGACNELKLFRPYTGGKYKLLKAGFVKEWISLLENLEGEVEKKSIVENYEAIEDNIDRHTPLSKEDILTTIYFGLSALVDRTKRDDYSEFYDLFTITDAINTLLNKTVLKDEIIDSTLAEVKDSTSIEVKEKPNVFPELANSRYAWVCLLDKAIVSKKEYKNLVSKYNMPHNRQYESFWNEFKSAKFHKYKLKTNGRNYFTDLPDKTKSLITECLDYAYNYFETKDEKILDELAQLRQITYE